MRTKNSAEPSLAKLASNRSNAKLSTGPITQSGKSHSRCNALKHGILTSVLLLSEGSRTEDIGAFKALLNDLRLELLPVGIEEGLLVEQIAADWWRLRRALESEAGLLKRTTPRDMSGPLLEQFLGRQFPIPTPCEGAEQRQGILLPLGADLDRILRYESAIYRQLLVARNQLERLQRTRQGEKLPAPLNVHLSTDPPND